MQRLPKVIIVGSPNVGKSVMFNALTGTYKAVVSNYPGTTVEVSRGKAVIGSREVEVVDTPGMYALLPVSEEEAVARRIITAEHPAVVLHVIDAKNLERMLPLTLQFIEALLPVILVLNVVDEARAAGMVIDTAVLEKELGIPVVETVSITGEGMNNLKERIVRYVG